MPSWDEVHRALRESFALDRDDEHEVALTLPVQGARAQRVMLRHYEALDADLVEIRSAFAEAASMDPTRVLEENLKLPIGAVAQHGRFLVVVHRCVLQHTSVEGVLFYATRIANVADWLESRQGSDRF